MRPLPIVERICEALEISLFDLTHVPITTEPTTLFDLLIVYDYTIGNGIHATSEIKEVLFILIQQVLDSDLTGDTTYHDASLIIERAKELIKLLKH